MMWYRINFDCSILFIWKKEKIYNVRWSTFKLDLEDLNGTQEALKLYPIGNT